MPQRPVDRLIHKAAWLYYAHDLRQDEVTQRLGILRSLYEGRDDSMGARQALDAIIHDVSTQMLGFAGVEMHRRIPGLAHDADFETIEDEVLRAAGEKIALILGRHLAVNRNRIASIDEVDPLIRQLDKENRH